MSFGLPKFVNRIQTPGVSNVSTREMAPPNVVKISIIPVDEVFNLHNQLLLNPSSISESKAANWIKHYIPGQSDPLLQWVSGSERTISFTAYVTKDIASNPTVTESSNADIWTVIIDPELKDQAQSVPPVKAGILSALAAPRINTSVNNSIPSKEIKYWSRSIQPQLDFYRSLVIPRSNNGSVLTKTPPLVKLQMGTLLGSSAEVKSQRYILASYSMNIIEYSPQLEPTKASVTFTFIEYLDKSKISKPTRVDDATIFTPITPDNATTIATGIRGRLS